MTCVTQVLAHFIDEWTAGQRPVVEIFLKQVDTANERDELADCISTFLSYAPTPSYDRPTIDVLLNESTVQAAAQAFESDETAWPTLLPKLRARAGLSVNQLAAHVLSLAGLEDRGQPKAARHLMQMERGHIDSTQISRRLLAVLSRVLNIDPAALQSAGIRGNQPPPTAVFRQSPGQARDGMAAELDAVADALLSRSPSNGRDEVDEFFFGDG